MGSGPQPEAGTPAVVRNVKGSWVEAGFGKGELKGSYEVVLKPSGNRYVVEHGETVLAAAMKAGIKAVTGLGPTKGAARISAGNYGGKLGKFHYHLKDLLP